MAEIGNIAEYESWLCKKLTDLEIDADVYGSYITGILEEEDETEDKKEALEGILGSLLEDPAELCEQVLAKWKPLAKQSETKTETKSSTIDDILAAHSAKVINVQTADKSTNNNSSGDSAIKRALLEKYAEVYEEVEEGQQEDRKPSAKSAAAPSLGLFQNVNVKAVSDAEKVKREKQKEESQKKKEKDKVDREKQKQKKEDRKEKEKKRTQKQERKAR